MTNASPQWRTDTELGEPFEAATLTFPDGQGGTITATLVRNKPVISRPRGTVLYLHGFIDYFFQKHLADAFTGRTWNFYALDLHRYGRSLAPDEPHPNFCSSLDEYDAEITASIDLITADGQQGPLIVNGHSTGALVAALYAKRGARGGRIDGLIFNSPFLDFGGGVLTKGFIEAAAKAGEKFPYGSISRPVSPWYAKSLHRAFYGEWCFKGAWKPIEGFPAYYGWLRAILQGQKLIAQEHGLELTQPVLVLHSDQSAGGIVWSDEFRYADLVLDVEDIRKLAPKLGKHVKLVKISRGVHDLVLSVPEVRAKALDAMFEWLGGLSFPSPQKGVP